MFRFFQGTSLLFVVDALLVWVGQQVVGLRMRTLRSLTQRAGVRGDGVPHEEFDSALQDHRLGVPHCRSPYPLDTSQIIADVDNPQTRPGTPLAFEQAFIFQLRNQAFSTSLRTSEVLRELSNS